MGRLSKLLSQLIPAGKKDIAAMSLEELVDTSVDLLEANQAERAKVLIYKAIEIQPDCALAWSNLAWAEIQLGNLSVAQEAAQKAISIAPFLPAAWHNLGEAHARIGNAEKSLECNNRALTIDPAQAVFWLGRGTALQMMARFPEAVASFDKALELNPGLVTAQLNKEMALLHLDPERYELLQLAWGIAVRCSEGKLNDRRLHNTVKQLFSTRPACDPALVRSFDAFAQINIQHNKAVIIYFCKINYLLATIVQDSELIQRCRMRVVEAERLRR